MSATNEKRCEHGMPVGTDEACPYCQEPRSLAALASGLAGQQNEIIRTCINEALGNEAWLIGDIASRMVRVRVVGQESETITLDGKPLLEIWPPEMKTVQEGNSWKMVATVKYRTFKAQNEKS